MTRGELEGLQHAAYLKWGIRLTVSGRELHGPCPNCRTGVDRFIVFERGNGWCRVCGHRAWVEEADTDAIAEARRKQAQAQVAKLSEWQAGYKVGYLKGYHDGMDETARAYWHAAGITDASIDRYMLGYVASRRFMGTDGQVFTSDAYVIPHRDPLSGATINAQYRINQLPPEAGGKYRQEPGLPAASFYTKQAQLAGRAIVVEGAKKAIVLGQLTSDKLQVVGLPGAMPGEALLNALSAFTVLWLILDPGAGRDAAIARTVEKLPGRIRIVEMPCKPDDAVTRYGLDAAGLRCYLEQSRRAQ